MKPIKFSEADFTEVEINGVSALFTDLRIDRNTLPPGVSAYDIRSSDDGEPFGTIEPSVWVNHTGTIVTLTPFTLNSDNYLPVEEYGFFDAITFETWKLKQQNCNGEPV